MINRTIDYDNLPENIHESVDVLDAKWDHEMFFLFGRKLNLWVVADSTDRDQIAYLVLDNYDGTREDIEQLVWPYIRELPNNELRKLIHWADSLSRGGIDQDARHPYYNYYLSAKTTARVVWRNAFEPDLLLYELKFLGTTSDCSPQNRHEVCLWLADHSCRSFENVYSEIVYMGEHDELEVYSAFTHKEMEDLTHYLTSLNFRVEFTPI